MPHAFYILRRLLANIIVQHPSDVSSTEASQKATPHSFVPTSAVVYALVSLLHFIPEVADLVPSPDLQDSLYQYSLLQYIQDVFNRFPDRCFPNAQIISIP